MRSILSQYRANILNHPKNISKAVKEQEIEGCQDKYIEINGYEQSNSYFYQKIELEENDYFCVPEIQYNFWAFGESLTFEGILYNGTKLGPVKNAFGAGLGTYKIIATVKTTVHFYSYYLYGEVTAEYVKDVILSFKKNWEGSITSIMEISETGYYYLNFNPFYYTNLYPTKLTVTSDKPILAPAHYESAVDSISCVIAQDSFYGKILYFHYFYTVPFNDIPETFGTYTGTAHIKIESEQLPEGFPDKMFKVTMPSIYSYDQEITDDQLPNNKNDTDDDDSPLGTGAIVGIVIACVVVVGVVAFCVVWFVVLKKGCGGAAKVSSTPNP